MRILKIG